jgi:hypothetical protein
MPDFALEIYVPAADRAALELEAARLAAIASQLTGDGAGVRYRRLLYLPSDETCFFVFAADSAGAVELVAARGELVGARVVEVTDTERSLQ